LLPNTDIGVGYTNLGILRDIDELCSKDIYLGLADDKDQLSPAFYHVLVRVMDGAEVAAALP
jgi:hypothetical protein